MLTAAPPRPEAQDAYQSGAATLLVAFAVILTALGFEHIGGHLPCPLCLQQRYAYYAGVPLLFVALILLSAEQRRLAALLFLAVAIGFLVNAGLGVYQAGAEWKYWPGPDSCATSQSISNTAGGLLKDLAKTKVIRCDEASWRFLGLSFAGWNAVVSLLLFAGAIRAAFAATARR